MFPPTYVVALLGSLLIPSAVAADSPKPTWKTLYFNGEYSIVKMTVAIDADVTTSWELGMDVNKNNSLGKFEISNKPTLRYLETTLFSVHKIAVDPDGGWIGPFQKVGSITVKTTKGQFEIGISNAGFILGPKPPTNHNCFHSWALAKVLEDGLTKHDKHFHEWNFDVLAGLNFAKNNKAQYEKMRIADQVDVRANDGNTDNATERRVREEKRAGVSCKRPSRH